MCDLWSLQWSDSFLHRLCWRGQEARHQFRVERVLIMVQTHPKLFSLAVIVAILGTLTGCDKCDSSTLSQKGVKMTVPDEMFKNVQVGSLEPNPCSPKEPDASFRGIRINAPKQVSFKKGESIGRLGAFALIPICGYYHLNVPSPPKYNNIFEAMTLVAINTKTKMQYAKLMMEPDTVLPPPKREPPPREEVANISVAGYFNPNLADYVILPQEPGIYDIHVELEEMKSNIVQIKLVEEK